MYMLELRKRLQAVEEEQREQEETTVVTPEPSPGVEVDGKRIYLCLEAGEDTAAVAYLNPGPISDYPLQEPWDLEAEMEDMEQVYAHQYGGPEDGWTEMCAGGDSPTDRIYYKADALSGLSEFWPVETPDLAWLEETYVPLPGGQCFLDWGNDFMPMASSLERNGNRD